MWDVKFFSSSSGVSGGTGFYLNYVGCKAKVFQTHRSFSSLFYLNYVGCKVMTNSEFGEMEGSFTLTMWDVKFVN